MDAGALLVVLAQPCALRAADSASGRRPRPRAKALRTEGRAPVAVGLLMCCLAASHVRVKRLRVQRSRVPLAVRGFVGQKQWRINLAAPRLLPRGSLRLPPAGLRAGLLLGGWGLGLSSLRPDMGYYDKYRPRCHSGLYLVIIYIRVVSVAILRPVGLSLAGFAYRLALL